MNKKILYIITAAVAALMVYILYSRGRHEMFDMVPLYSEPSLSCQFGASKCTLSNGKAGKCDMVTSACVEIPDILLKPTPDAYSLPPPVGEPSWDCQWRQICERSDGNMGVCMSSLCYPSTVDVQ